MFPTCDLVSRQSGSSMCPDDRLQAASTVRPRHGYSQNSHDELVGAAATMAEKVSQRSPAQRRCGKVGVMRFPACAGKVQDDRSVPVLHTRGGCVCIDNQCVDQDLLLAVLVQGHKCSGRIQCSLGNATAGNEPATMHMAASSKVPHCTSSTSLTEVQGSGDSPGAYRQIGHMVAFGGAGGRGINQEGVSMGEVGFEETTGPTERRWSSTAALSESPGRGGIGLWCDVAPKNSVMQAGGARQLWSVNPTQMTSQGIPVGSALAQGWGKTFGGSPASLRPLRQGDIQNRMKPRVQTWEASQMLPMLHFDYIWLTESRWLQRTDPRWWTQLLRHSGISLGDWTTRAPRALAKVSYGVRGKAHRPVLHRNAWALGAVAPVGCMCGYGRHIVHS